MKGTTTLNGRVKLEEALFNEEQLEKAMTSDSSITDYFRDIYLCGIERQATGGTVSEAQAKAIYITHKKIEKVLQHVPAGSTGSTPVAQRIDLHPGNLIGEIQALRALFKEMQ